LSHFKLGLVNCDGGNWRFRWTAAQEHIAAAGASLVAVIYADAARAAAPPADDVLAFAIASRAAWVLWDTFDKASGPLLSHLGADDLARQLAAARDAGLRTVAAGRLDESSIAQLPLELIDMVAVRGAACRASRDSAVCRERVRYLRGVLARHASCSSLPSPSVDFGRAAVSSPLP
jgi:uncharacterized protein (UPF0264 family)